MSFEPTVEISRWALTRLERGHLWVYSSDVKRVESASPGDVVKVVDGRGWFVGRAFYSAESQITLRMLTREDEPVDESFFARRLDFALDMRRRLFGESALALRLVHGEGDLLPGLIVDRYGDVLSVQTLIQATDRRKDLFFDLLEARLSPRAVVVRNDAKVRSHEGLVLESGVARGKPPGTISIVEGNVTLHVDPVGGQKTGGFLDQRENHLAAGALVGKGERCLDVFSYSGGFALQMARAGGRVTAVEISEKAVGEAEKAAADNELELDLVVANAFDWLKAASVDGHRFDVIVLDPPAFARSKAALPNALRGYKEINLRALQLLSAGGWLVTCSCSYHMSEEQLLELVLSAAQDAGRKVQLVERRGAGRDHPALLGVPETSYLKCLVLRRVD